MTDALNLYGDKKKVLSQGRGSDIASQRIDDLDRAALRHSIEQPSGITILDLGCGFPVNPTRHALLGHHVLAVDTYDFSREFGEISAALKLENITFLNQSLQEALSNWHRQKVDLVYSQRTIHYVHPVEMVEAISRLFEVVEAGGAVFVSASGLGSELGENYPGADMPWEQRFAPLSEDMQKKHGIEGDVCLYTEADLVSLFESAGFSARKIYSSPFGNVKASFHR